MSKATEAIDPIRRYLAEEISAETPMKDDLSQPDEREHPETTTTATQPPFAATTGSGSVPQTRVCLLCGKRFMPSPWNLTACRKCLRSCKAKDGRPS